ncbi:unnamed protein product, partial [Owenia fusiformis]
IQGNGSIVFLEEPDGLNMLTFDILMRWEKPGKVQLSTGNISGILGQWNSLELECSVEGCDSTSCCDVISCPDFHILKQGSCVYNGVLVEVQYEMNLLMSAETYQTLSVRFEEHRILASFDDVLPIYGATNLEGECKELVSFGVTRITCNYVFLVTYKVPCHQFGLMNINCQENSTRLQQIIEGAIEHVEAYFLQDMVAVSTTNWFIVKVVDKSQDQQISRNVSGDATRKKLQFWMCSCWLALSMTLK